jgi:tetratricopeptide (TPR) repeat protein
MINLAVSEENYLRADTLYRKLPPPRQDTLQWQLAHAYKTNDEALKRKLLDAYNRSTTFAPAIGANVLLYTVQDPEHFDALTRRALSNKLTPLQLQRTKPVVAAGLVEQGRMREALELLRPLDPASAADPIGRLTNIPLYELPRDQLLEMREQILRTDTVANGESPATLLQAHMRLYKLGVISCRLRDYTAAAGYAQRLQQLPVKQEWAPAMRGLANEISAQIDLDNGRAAEGLKKLESSRTYPPLELLDVMRFGVPGLIWKTEALYRAGRYEDAERYFRSMRPMIGLNTPHIAWHTLRRAQISDALGRRDDALLYYARFVRLFERADPEMQPLVLRARNRLAELQRQSG